MATRLARLFAVVVLALASNPAAPALIPFSDAGVSPGDITDTVNAFRDAIGGPNNGNAAGPLTTGRREINWDGAAVPPTTATAAAGTPFNGFQNTRGALFGTPGSGFFQATPAGLDSPSGFNRGVPLYDTLFDAFSLERVFTPIGSTITDVTFFIPGSGGSVPATVSAFGAIFLDVDLANISSLQFFEPDGDSLGTFFVPAIGGNQLNNTFSFLGLQANAGELIGRVRITSGNVALSATASASDQVVLDDLIFAEPRALAVPEPAPVGLLGIAAAALLALRRRKLQ